MVISFRHWMFDCGLLKSQKFKTPIICVGNITVGGTGKTPTAEMIIDYMKSHYTKDSIIIAVAGGFDDLIFDSLERYFGERKVCDVPITYEKATYSRKDVCQSKDFEQVQLIAGFKGIDIYDERVYSLLVFNKEEAE